MNLFGFEITRKRDGELQLPARRNNSTEGSARKTASFVNDFYTRTKLLFWDGEPSSEQDFKEMTESEILKKPPQELGDFMTKNEPTTAKVVDDFCSLCGLKVELTCEDERGQAIIDDALKMLYQKNNPFPVFIYKTFYSVLHRGNIFAEVVLNEMRDFENLFFVEPNTAVFQEAKDAKDGYRLGQLNSSGDFKAMDYDTVFFEAINPSLGALKGHSLIASAFPPALGELFMEQDLRKVVANHAWDRRMYTIDRLHLKEIGYTPDQIDKIVEQNRTLIESWGAIDPSMTPVSTSEIGVARSEGAGSGGGLNFVEMLGRFYDRLMSRGLKTDNFGINSNEFVSESSARVQTVTQSVWRSGYQTRIEDFYGRLFTVVVRAKGVAVPVVCRMRRTNAPERQIEAEAYRTMARGVKEMVSTGIPLKAAVMLYEHVAAHSFPEWLMDEIEKGTDLESEGEETE